MNRLWMVVTIWSVLLLAVLINRMYESPEYVTECISDHVETELVPTATGTSTGGVPIGENLEMKTKTVCDATETKHCVKWSPATKWTGKRCEDYQ